MKNVMTKKRALVYGMFWSIMMILFTVVLEPISEGKDIDIEKLWIRIPYWVIAGIVLGFGTRYLNNRSSNKKK